MTVTFCGHSKLYNQASDFSKWLDIIRGRRGTFYLGGYGAFDRLAAAAGRRELWTTRGADRRSFFSIRSRQKKSERQGRTLAKNDLRKK